MPTASEQTFAQDQLVAFAAGLLTAGGLDRHLAGTVADVLVQADMMGHETHGLALIPTYMKAIQTGAMATSGEPRVLKDAGGCVTWDGGKLPGASLVQNAVDLAVARAAEAGACTVSITNSYHMGALAVYLRRATERGMMVIIASSTPSVDGVVPHGGTRGVMTPNPLAAGIPTDSDPILLDISASITTRNKATQYAAVGRKFPGQWVQDADGNPTDDPAVLSQGGTLLPVGGLDHGHKGFALGLLVEALTQGLSGVGRADKPTGTYTAAFVQVFNPALFGGAENFTRITGFLAESCRINPPRPGVEAVRVPGDRAAKLRRRAEAEGVTLSAQIMDGLRKAAAEAGVASIEDD